MSSNPGPNAQPPRSTAWCLGTAMDNFNHRFQSEGTSPVSTTYLVEFHQGPREVRLYVFDLVEVGTKGSPAKPGGLVVGRTGQAL
jgi:hypothetical protein